MTGSPPRKHQSSRLIFTGGGTGGHLFPGIAVARAWREQHPDSEILFVGSNREIERKILLEAGFRHAGLSFVSPSHAWRHPIRFVRCWNTARREASRVITDTLPDLVIGLGGFSSYPLLRESIRQKIPLVLLEQNAVPGRVTSLFARQARCLCGSYESCRALLPKGSNYVLTGNPLRREVMNIKHAGQNESGKRTLLVCGGSQGSSTINRLFSRFAAQHGAQLSGWFIRHQTGVPSHSPTVEELSHIYTKIGISHDIREFYANPDEYYRDSKLMVCRAGGTTLAEAAYLGIKTLVVPIPNAVRNHQYANAAQHVAQHGGEIILEQTPTVEADFEQALSRMLRKASARNHPQSNTQDSASETAGNVDATRNVLRELNRAIEGPHEM